MSNNDMPTISSNPRILVVDDDPVIRDAVECLLSTWFDEAQVVTAADGREGLELCHNGNFDLIVTDIQMPYLDGIEMLKEIRRQELDVPAVVFSSSELPAQDVPALGSFAFLPKLDIQLLPAVAGELLTRRTEDLLGDHDTHHHHHRAA